MQEQERNVLFSLPTLESVHVWESVEASPSSMQCLVTVSLNPVWSRGLRFSRDGFEDGDDHDSKDSQWRV